MLVLNVRTWRLLGAFRVVNVAVATKTTAANTPTHFVLLVGYGAQVDRELKLDFAEHYRLLVSEVVPLVCQYERFSVGRAHI